MAVRTLAAVSGWPLLAAAGLVACICTIYGVLVSSQSGWNDVRLVRSLALVEGIPLYPGLHDGALFDVVYGPVSLAFYVPAALLGEPKWALPSGILISLALAFGGAAFVLWSSAMNAGADKQMRLLAIGLLFFHFYHAASQSAPWNIHVDAPTLAICAFAIYFAVLHRGTDGFSTRLAASAVLAGLAPWSKQSAAPLILVVAGYFLVLGAKRSAAWFAGLSLLTAVVSGAIFAACFGFEEMYLSMFLMPLTHDLRWSQFFYDEPPLRDLFEIAALAAIGVMMWSTGRDRGGVAPAWFSGASDNRRAWVLCASLALALLPTGLIARIKDGGSFNNYGYTDYFLMLAALLAVLGLSADPALRLRAVFVAGSRVALGILLFAQLLRSIPDAARLPFEFAHLLQRNPSQLAFEYELENSGSVYFPWRPFAVYRARGELFHVGYPVLDRSRAGMPLSEEHFRRHLPSAMKYVAFAPGAQQDILSRLPEWKCRTELDGLPGWDVYQRCGDR